MEPILFRDRTELKKRDPEYKAQDEAALRAIAQAAINVELFTIPLYMVSMYSIHGMHQINSAGNNFYQGRLWPGRAPSRSLHEVNRTPHNLDNASAFNIFFSVFIDEMLHLQLAANIASVLGVKPSFTSPALMNGDYGWTCYGSDETVIPHILNFEDTKSPYDNIRVKLDALTDDQISLFLVIEENDEDAREIIKPAAIRKYFPSVPFAHWSAESTAADLPMFGTIGHMYKCLWEYMEIEYTDGTTLFESVFKPDTLQRDLFNATSDYHRPEYPKMRTVASGTMNEARMKILDMINAITDQGEGQGVAQWISERLGLLKYAPVEDQFQPDKDALDFDYPNFTDTGTPDNPSGNTVARVKSGGRDHHDRFLEIRELLTGKGTVETWRDWHEAGNVWTHSMLETAGSNENKHPIPEAEDVADALNALKGESGMYDIFSRIAAGAIAGITRVLDDFWTNKNTAFPSPSMYGSGDRVSICWAIFGEYPKLSLGIDRKEPGTMYHACQGLSIANPADHKCAPVPVAHSCRGSNTCKAEGGCGFVQVVGSTDVLCQSKVRLEHLRPVHSLQAHVDLYSAPSDNRCAGQGGCAVPISASQMFPAPNPKEPEKGGTMELVGFKGPNYEPQEESIGPLRYQVGDLVYDVAWKAYIEVLQDRGVVPLPEKPEASALRTALPPST